MSDKKKNVETEFSFDFSGLANKIGEVVGTIGEEPETSYFDEKIGEATVAKVEINGGMGKLHVHPVEDEPAGAGGDQAHRQDELRRVAVWQRRGQDGEDRESGDARRVPRHHRRYGQERSVHRRGPDDSDPA
ncbi:MAG: hypothetical protein HND48_19225 [Chloroflexi bacterium]|nr:hypothetical protein [Chloroflexota bacterium]